MYLAEVRVAAIACVALDMEIIRTVFTTVKNGTKPEDLRVEIHCPHGKALVVPRRIEVPVLRYAPEACAEVLGVETGSLFTTGPFSWQPVATREFHRPVPKYQHRVLTIEEAKASGYSEEEIKDRKSVV